MPPLTLREATRPEDLAAVRALCAEFRLWLLERYAAHPWIIETVYAPEAWAPLMQALPRLHAPPRGAILLAERAGRPAGCAMLQPLPEAGVAELKRMYVAPFARGTGAAAALVEAMADLARARGYASLRLDTGFLQVEAMALYRRQGFSERGPYGDPPAHMLEILRFFERPL